MGNRFSGAQSFAFAGFFPCLGKTVFFSPQTDFFASDCIVFLKKTWVRGARFY